MKNDFDAFALQGDIHTSSVPEARLEDGTHRFFGGEGRIPLLVEVKEGAIISIKIPVIADDSHRWIIANDKLHLEFSHEITSQDEFNNGINEYIEELRNDRDMNDQGLDI